ncbi:MAG: polyphosphate polymerase domain-containing protein [Bacteroidota bacterium]
MLTNTEKDIVNLFSSISLDQMEGVKLMDRTDTKFVFHASDLSKILNTLKGNYRVLQVNNKVLSCYKTLYYDTQNFDLYLQHHNGKLNRYKIRHRTYVDSNIAFLEVKHKNNKGRTLKTRIRKQSMLPNFDGSSLEFLSSKLPFNPTLLLPKLWVNYHRITLVNLEIGERVTIDLSLEFSDTKKNKIALNNLIIAEVKQDKKNPSTFISAMKQFGIRPGSISKYCMAASYLNTQLKTNSFKLKLNQISKIITHELA